MREISSYFFKFGFKTYLYSESKTMRTIYSLLPS